MMYDNSIDVSASLKKTMQRLKDHKKVIHQLCRSLEEFLIFEVEEKEDQIEGTSAVVSKISQFLQTRVDQIDYPECAEVTLESLVQAQLRRHATELQLRAAEESIEQMPEAQAEYSRAVHLPVIQQALNRWDEIISDLQKKLENKESGESQDASNQPERS